MFNCPELERYLNLPFKERTVEASNKAYKAHTELLIQWWNAFVKRNPDTPIMRSDTIEINVPSIIANLIAKRDRPS
jgi:hypothetical protein